MNTKCRNCRSDNPETARFCSNCGTVLTPASTPPLPSSPSPAHTQTLNSIPLGLETGRTFAGRYQVIEELGRGGMGEVYKVYDTKIREKVALKLIRADVASDPESVERFGNELKLARTIVSRNVCRVFDLGEAEGLHYFTMEYVHGEDLKALGRKFGRFSVGQSVSIGKQISEGLAEAHRLGIVHRDLKPSNIMIDETGTARILDFGIASSIKTRGLTAANTIIGTPEYMSPEQIEGKAVDGRSDIYSLGIILYEMVTGRVPFEGDTPLAVGIRHKNEIPGNPREANPAIPEDFSRLILKCLEKDRDKRYATAADLRAELVRIEEGIPTTERKLARRPATSREITVKFTLRKLALPAALAVFMAAAGLWLVLGRKGRNAPPAERRSIAVISFENLTGESGFDGMSKVIPTLLITNLENSGYFDVVTWERLHDLIKKSGRPDADFIDRETGFELCLADGVEAIVVGTFAKGGNTFATDVKVYDVATKRLLKSANARGEGAESILNSQIDSLSREIARGVGMPDRAVEAKKAGIADLTTSSIEAYKLYWKGREDFEKFLYAPARDALEAAVGLDPDFAVAYLYLARAYASLGDRAQMNKAYERAKALSGRATEKERLYIEEAYAGSVEHDQARRLDILERMVGKFPKEKEVHYELGSYYRGRMMFPEAVAAYARALKLDPDYGYALNMIAYTEADMGNYEAALGYFKRYAAAAPGDVNPVDSMAEMNFRMGKLDEAAGLYREALRIDPNFTNSHYGLAYVLALEEDYPGALKSMEEYIAKAPSPALRGQAVFGHAFLLNWTGAAGRSAAELRDFIALAELRDSGEAKASADVLLALVYWGTGEYARARTHLESWYRFASGAGAPGPEKQAERVNYIFLLGMFDLSEHRMTEARARLTELDGLLSKVDPSRAEILAFLVSFYRGEVLLASGAVDEAIAVLEKVPPPGPPPSIGNILGIYNAPVLRDPLARAYAAKGDLDRAVAEYERLVTVDPSGKDRTLIHPLYHFRLAKLYEKKGLRDKAKAEYGRFLGLWRRADRGRPEVEEARKRLAAL